MNSQAAVRLDRLPMGRFHYKIIVLIGLGMFFDTFDIYMAGAVLAALVKSGWSNFELNAVFISVTFLGLVIGSWMSGFFGDRLGRRFSYQANLLLFGVASLVAAVAPNMIFLIIMRGIMGIGLGAEIVMGYGTLSEFVPPRSRGRWLSYLALITNSGLTMSALLGFLIIPHLGWRWMFVFVGVGALCVWYFRRVMPESPRWLEAKGLSAKAEEIVSSIEKGIEKEKGISLPGAEGVSPLQSEKQGSYLSLFRGRLLRRTVLAAILPAAQSVSAYTLINWLPTIFVKMGIDISKTLGYNTLIMIGAPFGILLTSFVVDHFGRKWTAAILFLACGVVGYIYALQTQVAMIIIYGFGLITLIHVLNPISWALYPAELFPTEIRFRGTGTAFAFARLTNVASPYGISWLLVRHGTRSVFEVLAVMLFLVSITIATIGIETKRKPLEVTSFVGEAA